MEMHLVFTLELYTMPIDRVWGLLLYNALCIAAV